MAATNQDSCQWLSVTEETLFLHDGLIRVTDLVKLPHDVNSVEEEEHEVVNFDHAKNPAELSERLLAVCGTHNNAYTRLLEYRLNALFAYWQAHKRLANEDQVDRDSATQEETITMLKKQLQGLIKEPEQASFSTRISLLLVLPLLQSQSRVDPELCGVTAELLLNCLRDCAPLSLTKEPGDCLRGIGNMLCSWLGEKGATTGYSQVVKDPHQRQNAAAAIVALACARGHVKTFIHTVHLLQTIRDIPYLPVADILSALLEMEGGPGQPSAILGSKHLVCWGFEDMLSVGSSGATSNASIEKESNSSRSEKDKEKSDGDPGRSITSDGMFLYTTNSAGRGLSKLGSGLHGSIRGYVYCRHVDMGPGKVAYGNGVLLYRPTSYDQETEIPFIAQLIDLRSLQLIKNIARPEDWSVDGPVTTIAFCSDGTFFYWVWCQGLLGDKNAKGQSVYMDSFKFYPDSCKLIPLSARVSLQRKDEAQSKTLNETLSRLRPHRGSAAAAATLVAITGAETITPRKEDSSTSVGISLKTLVRTPLYCDGNTVVIFSAISGGASNSAARSLFGSGGSLSSLRTLTSNLCFSVSDGQFQTRTDLIDAPTCALARGASILGLGVCFDVCNNLIWTCSSEWIDQFCNSGHQASHHVCKRLGLEPNEHKYLLSDDNEIPLQEVINQLLQHVGSMCIHQLNNDLLHTPLGVYILQQYPADLANLARLCDILETATENKHPQTIISILIVLQLCFKTSVFKREKDKEVQLVERVSNLVWKLLTAVTFEVHLNVVKCIQKEACLVISAGLSVLYPLVQDRRNLLHKLLSEGDRCSGLGELRDLLMVDFAEKLRNLGTTTEELKHLRLSNELAHYILRLAVKESCSLLRQARDANQEEFEKLRVTIPYYSPCLRYIMALAYSLLREAVLYDPDDDKTVTDQSSDELQDLQQSVLSLSSQIFTGAYEVLEVLLETCSAVIYSSSTDRLQGLERVAKSTILGPLLPVLLTALTHPNLRWLNMADTLMSQLVQLVVLTSQAALLLKSQVQAIGQDDLQLDGDIDIIEIIGKSVNLDKVELVQQEEQGFLAGLKIPAPWASGKSLESVHPVKDNYKFKETVQIPGARCLYLRFDTRCSSQYDYDKLVVYVGANINGKKIAEYGGNTYGFGSRSVLGSGWPKDLIKVEGDTVTVTFEMRSGREHNTPDKAMWGFLITIRAQECPEEVSNGLPFLADLALGLSVLACTMLQLLYQGPEKTAEEIACEHLLKSKLLQRCVWQTEAGSIVVPGQNLTSPVVIPIEEDLELKLQPNTTLPRVRMPADIVQKLRDMAGRGLPQLRPSIREVLQADVLEECIVSATIKHLSLGDTVHHLGRVQEQQGEDFWLLSSIMEEVYRRFSALLRQLQSLAELEQRWQGEVEDMQLCTLVEGSFFQDYHVQETKLKDLAMLCYLKDFELDPADPDSAVKRLCEKFDMEVNTPMDDSQMKQLSMPKTRKLVQGLLERLALLLQVNIAPSEYGGVGSLTRSTSHITDVYKQGMMVRSDTDVLKSYGRSMSAPSGLESTQDDLIIDIMKMQRRRHAQKRCPASILHGLVEEDESHDQPPHAVLIDQLFSFIGSDPEKAMSCQSFLSAAKVRWKRAMTRKQALVHIKVLLLAASRVGGATHLVAAVTSVLQHGPRAEELTCGGMVNEVQEAFAETMASVVQLAARYPLACCNSVGLLCTIPYTRAEEKCLVRCGLVHLLDRLCSLGGQRGDNSDINSLRQHVSVMAWAGFQVLANRCVTWETEDGAHTEELEHSGLACQVSMLLTNHLARATEINGNAAAGNEALQEVLTLLNNLSRSRIGKAILSQPACVSKLLSLLLDQRPSPKLVLVILQLCRVALPLMSSVDCEKVDLPAWGLDLHSVSSKTSVESPQARITSLLLAKLGDFLVPGVPITVSSRRPSMENLSQRHGLTGDKGEVDEGGVQDGRLAVFAHKREDQSSHEVIQPLLSSDSRPFRLGGGNTNMERVVRIDRDMTKMGKAEITTEDAITALRKAAKWAQMGLVVSTGPPVEATPPEPPQTDKKKLTGDVIAREKNAELARTDPVRPFISGHVSNSMAAEVIELLHSLLSESSTAQTWAHAVRQVLTNALTCLAVLINSVEHMGSPRCSPVHLMSMAKQANAALCAIGGFKETLKPGCRVKIVGEGIHKTTGQVVSVSEQTGLATVKLDPEPDNSITPRYDHTVNVPLSRLIPPRNETLSAYHLPMSEAVVMAVQALLLPQDGSTCPLQQPLPVQGDGNSAGNQTCRVVAEIYSRTCLVLSNYLQDVEFAKEFIQHCGATIDTLKSLAQECKPGDRLVSVEDHCSRLRMLYRDCAKPPPPPCKVNNKNNKEITWDPSRPYPPARACLFSYGLTGLTFLGDPSAGTGLPRGTMVYASQPIPLQAPSFYWELEVCSYGDTQEESSVVVSFGFAPAAEKREGSWTNPVGTCLMLNNGKAVHYNGASLLQWKSVRLDMSMAVGDVGGIGWEKSEEGGYLQGQPPKGRVYFTYNGRRLPAYMDDVIGGMFPVVHVQKKNTRVRANFGARPFAYAEGQYHRDAADEHSDTLREIRESFSQLPFCPSSDSEGEGPPLVPPAASVVEVAELQAPPSGPPCKVVQASKSQKDYNNECYLEYRLLPSYDRFVTTGPDTYAQQAHQEDESDREESNDDTNSEDHYALLVKAWEQKVFPIIRRRFRNEAERKDGLEQIRGALQLGMVDIARQTVEFLYEESGGMPRDLHLPTIDDIKEDLAKFTIERVKKGTSVIIRSPSSTGLSGATVLPKFAVRGMLRMFGLTGSVLDVDSPNELVQVETYLQSEGVLVRYWYPIEMLEKPPQGYRKSTITGGQTLDIANVLIHKELVQCELILVRMLCRKALLRLINHCNSPAMEVFSCGGAAATLSSGSAMAASAALLQELDIQNLQLLSNELLAGAQPHGSVIAQSLTTCQSTAQCLAPYSCLLSEVMYTDPHRLKEELAVAIARAANQGEDYLMELTTQLCLSLQTAPEMFACEQFPVTDAKVITDVHFPGAACLIVSCRNDLKLNKKDSSLYKYPWARVFCYSGHYVKKTGQSSKQEVVSYPLELSNSGDNDQYAPFVIPTDLIHVRIGVSPPPGAVVTIHSLPPQFLLAIAYIETLITEKYGCGTKSCEPKKGVKQRSSLSGFECETDNVGGLPANASIWKLDKIEITPPVFVYVVELLGTYLMKTDVPAYIKEYLFHLLAQTLRLLQYCDSTSYNSIHQIGSHVNPGQTVLVHLQTELRKLYDEETKGWTSQSTASGTGIGIGVSDQGRYTTYFHALMEVCLAIAALAGPSSGGTNLFSLSGVASASDAAGAEALLPATPSSPTGTTKRKKLKTKKERSSSAHKHVSGSRSATPSGSRTSESDTSLNSSSATSQASATPSSSHASDGATSTTAAGVGGGGGSGGGGGGGGSGSADKDKPLSSASSYVSAVSSMGVASGKSTSSLSGTKLEDMLWFHRVVTMSLILRSLVLDEPQGWRVMMDAVLDAAQVLITPTVHTRLLVITGIPVTTPSEAVQNAIRKVCNAHGGVVRNDVFVPVDDGRQRELARTDTVDVFRHDSDKREKQSEDFLAASDSSIASPPSDAATSRPSDAVSKPVHLSEKQAPSICGYAVVELWSKTKIDSAKKSLFKSKTLIDSSLDLGDIPEEMLAVSLVSQNLVTDPQANIALEHYLITRLLTHWQSDEIHDEAAIALTEIFHSCFIMDSRHTNWTAEQADSGYICLCREQIMHHTPGNLLGTFFNQIRAPKKSLSEQVSQTLRKYGFLKPPDKDTSPTDKNGKGKPVKKLSRPSKERTVMGTTEKPTAKERKTKSRDVSEKKESPTAADATAKSSKYIAKEEERFLTLEGFLQMVVDLAKLDIRAVWRALLACGFDLHFTRCTCIDNNQAQYMSKSWTYEMNCALVNFVNAFCRRLAVSPARLHPHEIYISEEELTNERYSPLQGVPIESIRLNFTLIQSLNSTLETFFLPLVDLRPAHIYSRSTAAVLSRARGLIFYDTKINLLNRILNASAQRKPYQAAPEITLDPLETIGAEKKKSVDSVFCQAYRQLASVSSSQLCVRLAAGGDPTYAFNVRMTGEEVHGNSGSFRQFLWQVAHELQSSIVSMLLLCPSAGGGHNKGKWLLRPGHMTYPEEKLIHFLGQLLGITIRADIPLGFDLLDIFWKNLVGVSIDMTSDLIEADLLTYSYIKKLEMAETESELMALCADVYNRFVYNSVTGEEVELINNGIHKAISWENHKEYISGIWSLRRSELICKERSAALRAGMSTVIPQQILNILSPLDLDIRTCGLPELDLNFLKTHTMYQVGLMETDQHIEYFWNCLEGLSQEDLCRFIKFACNQERIPQTCLCRDDGSDSTHVPPYPMKIAPPDGTGNPDSRYIRAETCMFMIKLPQYSCQEVMTQRLMYAIYCREDPLSG